MNSEILKEKSGKLWDNYVRHEFVLKMREGSLDMDSFKYYLIQDSKYVEMMLKSLLRASSLAPLSHSTKILKSIFDTRDKGMEVHSWLLSKLGISHDEIQSTGYSLANYAYTRHLYYYSTKSWEEFLAAWAPCMWGYYEVGKLVKDSPNELYSKWAQFYASDEYKSRIDSILEALNSVNYSETLVVPFINSVKFEIMFWESALKKEPTLIIGD